MNRMAKDKGQHHPRRGRMLGEENLQCEKEANAGGIKGAVNRVKSGGWENDVENLKNGRQKVSKMVLESWQNLGIVLTE